MTLRKRPPPTSSIFTGSMADVSFLLLIFFMVTAALSAARGIDLELPADEPLPNDTEIDTRVAIDVYVRSDGTLKLDGEAQPIAELLPYLQQRLELEPTKPVVLRTHPGSSYGAMVRVLDEIRSAPEKTGFEIRSLVIPTHRELQQVWHLYDWDGEEPPRPQLS